MNNEIKKDKYQIGCGQFILNGLLIVGLVIGVGFINYKVWRAEHPQAKTWTFFVPSGK